MSNDKELKRLCEDLQESVYEEAGRVSSAIDELFKMDALTMNEIKQSGVGKAVKRIIGKHPDTAMQKRATDLMMKWASSSSTATTPPPPPSSAPSSTAKRKATEEGGSAPPAKKPTVQEEAKAAADDVVKVLTSSTVEGTVDEVLHDEVRMKIRQLLGEALERPSAAAAGDDDEVEYNVTDVAARVEQALFEKHGQTTSKEYKTQVRSLRFNLKNAKNPGLRRSVMVGDIRATQLVNMSANELASQELQREREAMHKWNIEAAKARDPTSGGTTTQFKCHKCGQRETTYYQMQTRSADEPMTTFVTCVKCNNRWKC